MNPRVLVELALLSRENDRAFRLMASLLERGRLRDLISVATETRPAVREAIISKLQEELNGNDTDRRHPRDVHQQ